MIYDFNMDSTFSYIGMFEVGSDGVSICDPYVSGITVCVEKIPSRNEASVNVHELIPGIYYAYHQLDAVDGRIINLIVVHKDFDVNILKEMKPQFMGNVCVTLGSAVVIADRSELFNSDNCYYSIQEAAYYSCDVLMQCIDQLDPPLAVADEIVSLRSFVCHQVQQGVPAVKGEDILHILGSMPLGKPLRAIRSMSSQWSVEIINGLYDAYNNSLVVKGGIASLVAEEQLPVYVFSEKTKNAAFAICVTL